MIVAGAVGLGLAATGATAVFAADATPQNPMSGLVNAIATKFNLNAADVEAVVRAEFEARRAEMEAKMKEHLATLVKEGKITQAQADKRAAHKPGDLGAFGPRGPGHMKFGEAH